MWNLQKERRQIIVVQISYQNSLKTQKNSFCFDHLTHSHLEIQNGQTSMTITRRMTNRRKKFEQSYYRMKILKKYSF